jgi:hypothetical protein
MRRKQGREVVYVERGGDSSAKWLFWGAVLGAGLALLYAPRTGEETRRSCSAGCSCARDRGEADELAQQPGGPGALDLTTTRTSSRRRGRRRSAGLRALGPRGAGAAAGRTRARRRARERRSRSPERTRPACTVLPALSVAPPGRRRGQLPSGERAHLRRARWRPSCSCSCSGRAHPPGAGAQQHRRHSALPPLLPAAAPRQRPVRPSSASCGIANGDALPTRPCLPFVQHRLFAGSELFNDIYDVPAPGRAAISC